MDIFYYMSNRPTDMNDVFTMVQNLEHKDLDQNLKKCDG